MENRTHLIYAFASLDSREVQKYSFRATGIKKEWFFRQAYIPDYSFYIAHLTDPRGSYVNGECKINTASAFR